MRNLASTTAVAPALWGTTYLVTTELLPDGRPLLAGTLRALPAGLLLIAAVVLLAGRRAVPSGAWWWRAAVLGFLNIGLFFALLFVAAYRLPGGIAAVLGALGPFVVAALAFALLGQRPGIRVLLAGAAGLAGVALLVLRSDAALDPLGLAAAAAGMVSMSFGTVLGRRWGTPPGLPDRRTALLALTGWQLTVGGLLLAPVMLVVEGLPPALSWTNVGGFGYLSLVGTAGAYFLWFRGVTGLAPARVTLLGLLSPVGAALLGWLVLGQSLSTGQLLGATAVLAAVVLGTRTPASPPLTSPRVDLGSPRSPWQPQPSKVERDRLRAGHPCPDHGDPPVRALVDFDQQVRLLLVAMPHFIPDSADLHGALRRHRDAVALGRLLAVTHGTAGSRGDQLEDLADLSVHTGTPPVFRDPAAIAYAALAAVGVRT